MRVFITILSLIPLIILYIPLFSNQVILGGEGLFTVNYHSLFSKFFSFWFTDGFGHPNVLFNFIGLPQLIFFIIEFLKFDYKIINTLYFSVLFILPFVGFYLFSFQLTKNHILSISVSSFYCFNAFTLSYLSSLNITNASSISVIPFLLYVYLRFYNSKYLFLIFGLVSILFSYSYYNPPTFVATIFSIIAFIPIKLLLIDSNIQIKKSLIEISKILLSLIIFNLWWIVPVILSLSDASSLMSKEFALSWESSTHKYINNLVFDLLFLNHFKYLSTIIQINNFYLILIVYLFLLYYLFKNIDYKSNKFLYLLCLLIFIIFFMKGSMPPFGFIYDLLLKHIPFFWIMKSPIEKFSIPFIFYFSLLILFVLNKYKNLFSTKIVLIFLCSFISIPYLIFNNEIFLGKYKHEGEEYSSKRYITLNDHHLLMIEHINSLNIEGRILLLPQHYNYQSMIVLDDNKNVYTGLSYIDESINAQVLRLDHQIYKNFSTDLFMTTKILDFKYLDMFAVQYILVNKDMQDWFGFVKYINLNEYPKFFEKVYVSGNLTLFKVNKKFEKISIPRSLINLKKNDDD